MTAELARRIVPLIDLTSLGDDDTPEMIDALCEASSTPVGPVAAVCVWPAFVAQARSRVGNEVGVAGVANFPEGDNNPARAIADALEIVGAGGNEVDVVLPWRALAAGERGVGRRLVAATREAIGDDVILKVILETGELATPELIEVAAMEALEGGADYLKTSTGKTAHSASLDAARILLQALADHDQAAGIKISGGIRTVDQALPYLALADELFGPSWVSPATFRFGASSLLDDVLRACAAEG